MFEQWMSMENPAYMWKTNLGGPKRAALGHLCNFNNKASNTKFKTVQQDKALNAGYTRMLQRIPDPDVHCVDHVRNVDLCRGLPRVTDKVRDWRTMRLAGHCETMKHLNLMANKLTQDTARRAERRTTYVDTLQRHSRANNTAELLMGDRKLWRASILESRRTEVARVEAPPQAPDVSMKKEEKLAFPDPLLTVEDIDAGDSTVFHCSENVKDIYAHLMDLEVKKAVRPGYLKGYDITAQMRAKLINWLIQVQSSFELRQETLYLAVAILDHFLQVRSVSPKKLQLVGVAAILLASKYEEMRWINCPRIQDFADITDNAFTTTQIKQMERVMLKYLNYELGFPLPLHFLRRASKAANCTVERRMLAKYLMELTLLDYDMIHYRPSEIAAASLCLSQLLLGGLPWTPTEQHYTTYDEAHLKPIMQHIAKNVVVNEGETKFQAIKTKYSESKLMNVTHLSELQSSIVQSLAAPLLDLL